MTGVMRSGRLWAYAPAAILACAVVANTVLVYCALGDPSFAIEKDYHRRALAFDAEAARARASRALGWRADVEAAGAAGVAILLHDAAGAPVSGAAVSCSAFHNARAGSVATATATPAGPGRYEARIFPDRPGVWVFRIEARPAGASLEGPPPFVTEVRRDLPGSAP